MKILTKTDSVSSTITSLAVQFPGMDTDITTDFFNVHKNRLIIVGFTNVNFTFIIKRISES